MRTTDTKIKILKEGHALLQKHGYNGFSFQDIANALEIKKPSLYDHYASKEELILAILEDYTSKFNYWSSSLSEQHPTAKIKEVFNVFFVFSCDGRKVCPVLALITDLKTLSRPIQNKMKEFITLWLDWLAMVIQEGQNRNEFRHDLSSKQLSEMVYSQIMGCQLQARLKNNPQITLDAAEIILRLISAESR